MCLWGCLAEPREKNGKRKRDGEERREKKLGGKGKPEKQRGIGEIKIEKQKN